MPRSPRYQPISKTRTGQFIVPFGKRAVEPRDDLTFGHRHAFVDEDLDHLPVISRVAARHHIAGGRQIAGRLVIRGRLLRCLWLRGGLLCDLECGCSLGGSCLRNS